MRESWQWIAAGLLAGACVLAILACHFDSFITVNLPPKPPREAATTQPSGSFLDRLLEDIR